MKKVTFFSLVTTLFITAGVLNYAPGTGEAYSVYITGVEVKKQGKIDKYLIYAKDPNGTTYTFENTDAYLRGKTNSSDIQSYLYSIADKPILVKLTVTGWRISLLSKYKNIISYEKN